MEAGGPIIPDTNQEVKNPRSRRKLETVWLIVRSASIGIAIIIAMVILALKWPITRNAILIFLLSVGLAYVIAPLANHMRPPSPIHGKRLTPVSALLFIYLLLILIGTTAWMVAGERLQREVTELQAKLPAYADQARQRLQMFERIADRIPLTEPLAGHIRSLAVGVSTLIQKHVMRVGQEMAASRPVLSWLWLVPAISLFLISRVGWFERSAVSHLPEGHMRWRGEEFFQQVNSILAGYTRAQFLSCGIIMILSLAGFWVIGFPYAPLMALISGALEVLPVVGPLTVAIAACTIVGGDRLFVLIGFLAAMRLAQDYVIYPRLVGHRMHLHPVAVVCVILAGGIMGGMLGVLAAVPLVGVASVAMRHWREYWELEKLVREHGRPSAEG
jgi:predicted PurR-regulated permease PerM